MAMVILNLIHFSPSPLLSHTTAVSIRCLHTLIQSHSVSSPFDSKGDSDVTANLLRYSTELPPHPPIFQTNFAVQILFAASSAPEFHFRHPTLPGITTIWFHLWAIQICFALHLSKDDLK